MAVRQVRRRFTPEMQEELVKYANEHPAETQLEIAQHFGYTVRQVRDRLNYKMPPIPKEWTREEDELLLKFGEKFHHKWSIIEEIFGGTRLSYQLRSRYAWLCFLQKRKDQKGY
jgi:hypothetical protein